MLKGASRVQIPLPPPHRASNLAVSTAKARPPRLRHAHAVLACGRTIEQEFRFCPFCGADSTAPLAPSGGAEGRHRALRRPRRLHRARGAARPRGCRVRSSLPYHAHVRGELERFGGTVEKFIGDAVMALFGAPIAHEDDPERAVRAGLAIRDWAREQADLAGSSRREHRRSSRQPRRARRRGRVDGGGRRRQCRSALADRRAAERCARR